MDVIATEMNSCLQKPVRVPIGYAIDSHKNKKAKSLQDKCFNVLLSIKRFERLWKLVKSESREGK